MDRTSTNRTRKAKLASSTSSLGAPSDMHARALACGTGLGLGGVRGQEACSCKRKRVQNGSRHRDTRNYANPDAVSFCIQVVTDLMAILVPAFARLGSVSK